MSEFEKFMTLLAKAHTANLIDTNYYVLSSIPARATPKKAFLHAKNETICRLSAEMNSVQAMTFKEFTEEQKRH